VNWKFVIISAATLILIFTTSTNSNALNTTKNDSYAPGSVMASANQTTSELGHNASLVLDEAGEEVASALNQLGSNMSDVGVEIGSEILNETEEAARDVGKGAKDVLRNITGEIKQGITGK
jgi:hypothetical protein